MALWLHAQDQASSDPNVDGRGSQETPALAEEPLAIGGCQRGGQFSSGCGPWRLSVALHPCTRPVAPHGLSGLKQKKATAAHEVGGEKGWDTARDRRECVWEKHVDVFIKFSRNYSNCILYSVIKR